MVASFRAIHAFSKKTGKAFDGAYYTLGAFGDYVARGGERLGEWIGGACSHVGVRGAVIAEHFKRLLHEKHPITGADLRPHRKGAPNPSKRKLNQRNNRIACIDITFTPDKSFSAYLVYASPRERRLCERCLMEAATETLLAAEETLPLARIGKAGRKRILAKIIAALFLHRVNRLNEPNWHVHAAILRACRTEFGWSSINTKMLRDWTRSLGPVFRSHLTYKMREKLGIEFKDVIDEHGNKKGWARIDVPLELCEHWSSRKKEIDQHSQEHSTGSDPTAQAKAKAALLTRGPKKQVPPENELIAKLRADGARFGFAEPHAAALLNRSTVATTRQDYKAAFDVALAKLSQSESHFSHSDVVREVAENLQANGMPARELMRHVTHDLQNSQEVILVNPTPGETRYTTRATWELEEKCEQCADQLFSRPGASVPSYIVDRHLKKRQDLSPEQREAARHLLTSTGSMKTLTGIAGSGKSHTLDFYRDALEKAGYNVLGAAVSGAAKEELAEKAHIKCRTVASWLYHLDRPPKERAKTRLHHHSKQLLRAARKKTTYRQERPKLNRKSVLIIDEAGMLDTATAYRLFKVVEKAGATVVLVGDEHQIQSIGAGGVLARVKEKHPFFHMKENWRQLNTRDQIATELLRAGKGKEAMQDFSDRKRLSVSPTRTEAINQLVSTWETSGGIKNPDKHLVFTMTRDETKIINRKLQAARLQAKVLDSKRFVTVASDRIHVADRIMVHQPLRQFGLENGYRGTVVGIDPRRRIIHVRFDQKVRLFGNRAAPGNVVSIPLRQLEPNAIGLSYAMTTHKGQGQTCEHAYLLVGGQMTDKELTYTQTTRGRRSTRLFVDALHAGEQLSDISATVSRSRKKELAHHIAEQHQQAPIALELEQDATQ